MSSILVVFSMDLMSTRVLGVMGELASLSGLKLRTAFMMRLDVDGLVRIRMDREFMVPSTTSASLNNKGFVWLGGHSRCEVGGGLSTYLLLSWSTLSILSRRPVASASSCLGSRKGWPAGTIPKETSRPLR